jgi:hypothetical protein
MAKVRKTTKFRRLHGYSGKRSLSQQSTEERARRRAVKARAKGKGSFSLQDTLFVWCGDKYVEWSQANPAMIGKRSA